VVGEVERCCPSRQVDHIASRRHRIDTVREQLALQALDRIALDVLPSERVIVAVPVLEQSGFGVVVLPGIAQVVE